MASGEIIGGGLCPCGKRLNGFTGAGHDQAPSPGDLSICVYCERYLQWTPQMEYRELSAEEFAGLHPENRLQLENVRLQIRLLKRANPERFKSGD